MKEKISRKLTGGGEGHPRNRRNKALLSVLLSIVMVIGMLPVTAVEVRAAVNPEVTYRYPVYNETGVATSGIKEWKTGTIGGATEAPYEIVEGSTSAVTWSTGWYVVTGSDVTISNTVTVSGDVNLILTDGCKLTVSGSGNKAGICVTTDSASLMNTLTIYAGNTSSDISGSGTLSATGGTEGTNGGAGIGGGKNGNGSNIIINGGNVTANGSVGGAGIGGGSDGSGSNITINGGTVTANGGILAVGIGSGNGGSASSNIIAAPAVVVKAGSDSSSASFIKEVTDTTTDITTALASSQYVRAGVPDYLTFTAQEADSTVKFEYDSGSNFQFSFDGGASWQNYPEEGLTFTFDDVSKSLSLRGTDVKTSDQKHFSMTGKIAASGSVTSLTDGFGDDPGVVLVVGCYFNMFRDCTAMTTAPKLSATTLAVQCYSSMFNGCTALTAAPELPATVLAKYCYSGMFDGCTALTTAPELHATVLADFCYTGMFDGCTALTTAPELPATVLAKSCYSGMFDGCTTLTTAPELHATVLADFCYFCMFYGCVNLMLNTESTKGTEWKIPDNAAPASNWNVDMFTNTLSAEIAPEIGITYYQQQTPWNQFSYDSYIDTFVKSDLTVGLAKAVANAKIAEADKSKTWVVFADGTDGKYKTLIWDTNSSPADWKEAEKSDSELRSHARAADSYVYVIGTVGTQTAITALTLKNDKLVYDNTEKTVEIASVKAGETVLTKDVDYTIVESESSKQKATAIGEYTITVSGKGKYSGNKSATWYIKKVSPAAPTGLESFAPSKEGGDGKITGVTDKMEYKINDGEWTDCSGTEITGLDACKVYVRVKETDDTYAGTAAEVIVGAYVGFDVTYELSGKGADWQEELTVEVASGSNAKRPETDPSETGWSFLGWFESLAEAAREWAFDGEQGADDFKILKATTIYAKWDQNEYTVTFDSDGGSAVPSDTVQYGEKVTRPTDPVKNGYTFDKWTYDDNGTAREWLFDTMTVTEDLTLTATWKKKDQPGSDDDDDNRSTTTTSKPAKTGSWDSPVSDGTWAKGSNGKWMYKTNANFRDIWGYIQYTDRNGIVQTGWFWFDANGYMVTGWVKVNGNWFYFDETEGGTLGIMKQGWIEWNGNRYYLSETRDENGGKMLVSTTTPDGYVVDETGKMTR